MYMIITKVFVLSGRYTITMAFMLLILASFGIAKLLQNHSARYRKKIAVIVLLIFSITLLKNLMPKPEGFNFRQDAMIWLKQYNIAKEDVFINDLRLAYYYEYENLYKMIIQNEDYNLTTLEKINNSKYISLYITRDEKRLYDLIKSHPEDFTLVKVFCNGKRDKSVAIFEKITR